MGQKESMGPQALTILDGLEFRTPTILHSVEHLSEADFRWRPASGGNSIAWLIWHIPEVEDNWIRDHVYGLPKRYPFGTSVKAASAQEYPTKSALLTYFQEVRALTKERLEKTLDADFDRVISDDHFGAMTVRQLWGGVVSSCAWHGGQVFECRCPNTFH